MIKIELAMIMVLLGCISLGAQEKVVVEGSIKLSDLNLISPVAGTIRWTGFDFEGYNGLEWVSLTGASSESTVTDVEGNIYKTKKIGDQIWMTENLRTSKYRNGMPIPNVTSAAQWTSLVSGAWCWYNNDQSLEITYGKLYNWFTVNDGRQLCPEGWHVPLQTEWLQLANFLGGLSVAGGKMKETGTIHWMDPNLGATNVSGFTGLPGGFRFINQLDFTGWTVFGVWWSSNDFNASQAHINSIEKDLSDLDQGQLPKTFGLSIRCLKDN